MEWGRIRVIQKLEFEFMGTCGSNVYSLHLSPRIVRIEAEAGLRQGNQASNRTNSPPMEVERGTLLDDSDNLLK